MAMHGIASGPSPQAALSESPQAAPSEVPQAAPSESPPAAQADEGADKESQILDGAALIFARDGYEGASMSRIASEAGVSKGTLYNYFSNKAELFAAYVHRECSRSIALIFDDLDQLAPPAEALMHIGSSMFRMLLSETGLIMYRMVVAEAEKFPELAEAFYGAGPAKALAHVSAYLRRAAAEGRLVVADPDFAAEQFFALMQTHLCMKRRLRLIPMPSQEELDHVIRQAVKLFLAGYGTVEERITTNPG